MRKIVVGITLGIVALALPLVLNQMQSTAYGQRNLIPGQGSGQEILLTKSGDAIIVLVDTRQKVITSYEVDPKTGEISLLSVRNITWDLIMDDFNGKAPKPKEIRAMLEQQ